MEKIMQQPQTIDHSIQPQPLGGNNSSGHRPMYSQQPPGGNFGMPGPQPPVSGMNSGPQPHVSGMNSGPQPPVSGMNPGHRPVYPQPPSGGGFGVPGSQSQPQPGSQFHRPSGITQPGMTNGVTGHSTSNNTQGFLPGLPSGPMGLPPHPQHGIPNGPMTHQTGTTGAGALPLQSGQGYASQPQQHIPQGPTPGYPGPNAQGAPNQAIKLESNEMSASMEKLTLQPQTMGPTMQPQQQMMRPPIQPQPPASGISSGHRPMYPQPPPGGGFGTGPQPPVSGISGGHRPMYPQPPPGGGGFGMSGPQSQPQPGPQFHRPPGLGQPGMTNGLTSHSASNDPQGYPSGLQSGPMGRPPQPQHGLPNGPMSHQPGSMGMGAQPQLQQGQGYPPQPQPNLPHGPGVGYPPGAGGPAPNQGRKLDPDQMPSAIGVMQEDQQGRGGTFQTGQRGLLPPLVTTKFQVEDLGNASPRFVRSTMYSVPAQPDMLKQTAVPFALVVNPFEDPGEGEAPLACVDLGPMGPVRCIRCKAYMSPLMQFIDGGRRFQCLLCKATTEVPPEYFQHLDHTGQRVDKWERPELWRGSYEFMATLEYCRNSAIPKEPGYIFVMDVSYNNVKSGLVNLICQQMPSLLEMLPPHTPVGFITYNSKVHFYNIDPSLAQPQMVIVPDVADMFMPILTGFLVPRSEAVKSIAALMNQIPTMFGNTKETDVVLGPAIQAGMEALKASDRVGKLLILHSALPSSESAPGKLKNREADRKLLGTDKEKVVLTPQSTYYNTLGQDCVGNGVSVDLYLFNNSYIDVATIGQVARITGGSVNKYTYFQADIDGTRVIGELKLHLGRPTGFDGVMRVRTSTGVRPTDFHGHFYMSNTTDVELGAIDSYKGIAVEIKHDDKLTDEEGVYIQIALLYTSIFGQRRLRIHNLALNTCLQMADLYRNCELDTIINFLAKQCISKSVDATPQTIKDGVINRCAQMLATYRKHCANPSMPGQLILPECLKLLPLYVNCVLRSDAVSGNQELTPDDRSWLMYTVMTMGVGSSVHYFYPKLIPVAGPTAQLDNPAPVRCSHDKLRDDSAFILENGIYIFLWIGSAVSSDWLQNIFGISNLAQINVEVVTELPDQVNTDESLQLKALIRSLRSQRQRHMRLTVVRQRDKMELVMNKFLVEDRSSDGHPSYVDFLCHMHKEIRGILNQ